LAFIFTFADFQLWGKPGLELSGGWGLNPPVHVYRRSFLSENRP